MDEVTPNEWYMAQTGRPTGQSYGLVFDRFYRPSDFDSDGNLLKNDEGRYLLPEQPGTNKPGDPLFKDLNNDGKIDGNDCTFTVTPPVLTMSSVLWRDSAGRDCRFLCSGPGPCTHRGCFRASTALLSEPRTPEAF